MVMINTEKRCFVDEPLVFYRTNTETQISANRNPMNLYRAIMLLISTRQERVTPEKILRWGAALLIMEGISELKRSNDENLNRQFYDLWSEFFSTHKIRFRNKRLAAYSEYAIRLPYDSKWFYETNGYFVQLELTADKLEREMRGNKLLFLWGLGKRGKRSKSFAW